jgi:hypothetical protein
MSKYIVSTVLVAALLVATNANADTVVDLKQDALMFVGAAQKDAYLEQAAETQWALIGAAQFNKEKAPYEDFFEMTSLTDPTIKQQGSYKLDVYNGMGAGYAQALSGTDNYGGMSFSHNSANMSAVQTPDGLLNSFFFNVGTHANENSTQGTFNITLTTNQGTKTYNNIEFGWVGFVLADGEYLTGFEIEQNSNPNTGFWFDFVPGKGTDPNAPLPPVSIVPEPATMLIMGLGIAGAGWIAHRRLRKKKNRGQETSGQESQA